MIDSSIILAIACGKAKSQEVTEYCKKLEAFLDDGKNVIHPDYYDAEQQLSQCYNYLAQIEQLDKNIVEDKYSGSFQRGLKITLEQLEEKLRNLSYQNLTEDKLEGALLYLADEAGTTVYNLRKYYESIKSTEDREEFIFTVKAELDLMQELEAAKLDLREFLPPLIANEIITFATKLEIRPECCLTALITALPTCCKIGTQLEINADQGFYVSPYQFSMIVAESGSTKTAIYEIFARDPLAAIQESVLQAHKEHKAEVLQAQAEYEQMDEDERKLEYPEGCPTCREEPKVLHFGSKTMEAISAQFEMYPDQPLAYMKDELSGLFLDADKYNGGKGSESKDLMSAHGGILPPVIRKNGGLIANPRKVGINIFGTIQPEVLQEFWSSVTDPDGYWSRFLYCYQGKAQKSIPPKRTGKPFTLPGLIETLFRAVYTLQPINYKLCDRGYSIYANYYNHLGKSGYKEVHPALSKAYSKALGLTGRLILMLHIIKEVTAGEGYAPAETVDPDTVNKGIALMQFYLKQRILLNKKLCNQESISPQLKAVDDLSKRLGSIAAREVKQNIWYLRDSKPNEIRNWFLELVEAGYGHTEGKGSRLRYQTSTKNPLQFE